MASTKPTRCKIGDVVEVEIGKVVHGGHFIARHNGAVIFLRHAIPGEKCRVVITSIGASFNRGDVIEVLETSSDRISPPCQYAHRSGCGGCDFQHISLNRQRQLKSLVITEQFSRIAKMELNVEVEEVAEPLHWRTRLSATTTSDGKLGFYGSRSHTVIPIDDCIVAIEAMKMPELSTRVWKGESRVEIAVGESGERSIALAAARGESKARLTEGSQILQHTVGGRVLEVSHNSFWQSHIDAPRVLISAVLEFAELRIGDQVLDLYGGVGLFTAAMIEPVGVEGSIDLIESSKSATMDAKRNFADCENVKVFRAKVAEHLPKISRADVVILDPPREGAGKTVVNEIVRLAPRAVVYVACDPAALARDTAYLMQSGFSLAKIRAFDLFPMTHHIECVALYLPT